MARILLIASALLLTACGGGGSGDPDDTPPETSPDTALLEVIHASPDAPDVNVVIDGETVAEAAPYKSGLTLASPAEDITLAVQGLLPGAGDDPSPLEVQPVTVIEAALATPGDTRVTVFAANNVADIEPIVVTTPVEAVAEDSVRLRVVHAAPIFDPEMVAVHLTAVDEPLGSPTETFAFGGDFGPVEVPADEYRIRITPAGDSSTILFDSGPLPLPGGSDLVVAAVVSALPEVPLSLLVADGTAVGEVIDSRAEATLRVVHAAPDAPMVDVIIDDALPAAVEGLAFPAFTDRLSIAADDYNIKVVPSGEGPEAAVIDADATLVAGVEYSVYAVGLLPDVSGLLLVDDNRRVNTEARLRLVHAAPSAGDVDIYLAPAGEELGPAALAAVPFAVESGYLPVAPGSYDVVVAPAGEDPMAPAIGPLTVNLEAGGIYTVVARDAAGGGGPFDIISLDDALN